jgi:hypothetical protein
MIATAERSHLALPIRPNVRVLVLNWSQPGRDFSNAFFAPFVHPMTGLPNRHRALDRGTHTRKAIRQIVRL